MRQGSFGAGANGGAPATAGPCTVQEGAGHGHGSRACLRAAPPRNGPGVRPKSAKVTRRSSSRRPPAVTLLCARAKRKPSSKPTRPRQRPRLRNKRRGWVFCEMFFSYKYLKSRFSVINPRFLINRPMKEGKHRATGQWEVINHRRRPLASAVVPREQGSSIRSAADGASASQLGATGGCYPSPPHQSTPPFTQTPLELELIQPQMTQKPVLRGEVGARALRVRSVSREDAWASAGAHVDCITRPSSHSG